MYEILLLLLLFSTSIKCETPFNFSPSPSSLIQLDGDQSCHQASIPDNLSDIGFALHLRCSPKPSYLPALDWPEKFMRSNKIYRLEIAVAAILQTFLC